MVAVQNSNDATPSPLSRFPEKIFAGKFKMTINCVRFVFHDILYILQGDWLTKEYNRLNEERRKAGDTVNPEPTFDEILKQERMPQNLEGYIDPIKMWVKYDGESKFQVR